MSNDKIRKVLVQVKKGFREGHICVPGDFLMVDERRVGAMIKLGYVKRIDPNAPFDYPAAKSEHKFQQVVIEKDEVKPAFISPSIEPASSIETLEFLNGAQIKALSDKGIDEVLDLRGWGVDELCEIFGIGKSTAKKLLDIYESMYGEGYNSDDDIETVTK